MKYLIAFLLVIFCSHHGYAQIKWEQNRPLTWADFKGPVDIYSPYAAITSVMLVYKYTVHYANGKYALTFDIDCLFLPASSWTKPAKQNASLLKHEQLHFDIRELYGRKLMAAFNAATYTANYKAEIKTIYDSLSMEAKAMEARYDVETNHFLIKDKQLQWENFVKGELNERKQ